MKLLHWAIAGTAGTCVVTVQLQQNTKDPQKKGEYMFWHKSAGLLTGMLAAPRVLARLATKAPAALPGPAIQHFAGQLSHVTLYAFVRAAVLPHTAHTVIVVV